MFDLALGLVLFWIVNAGEAEVAGVTLKELKNSPRYDEHVLKSPIAKGPYQVNTITYGSENSYRKEFNQNDSLFTKTVVGYFQDS
ncbi:hypothetical protein KHA94_09690 [Bacillus sp. FJAT-49705]|uniref:Uncharacterized protein n=1 Tax=Cytobacillus citreus TaxID=2833586 RepID=A0ABS5NSD3_9BACI|nr:hypothetical protein [Cytobacillus citreus]MBS4190461.1 hypothetical protein [Cytobacillus citreus]